MRILVPLVLVSLCAFGCKREETAAPVAVAPPAPHVPPALPMTSTPTAADDAVLATVNGKPLTMEDVRFALRMKPSDPDVDPAQLDPVLDGLIRREITAQEAEKLGLDKTATFQSGFAKAMAPVTGFRHRVLGDAYVNAEIAKLPQVTEAEAKKFWDDNKELLASDVHVEQILTRDEGTAQAALAKLKAGKSMAEVARSLNPAIGADDKPWELPWQPWQIVPEQWRKPLATMKPGDISDVITGAKNRFWVIKLIERRPSKSATFEEAKAGIITRLTDLRGDEARGRIGEELVSKATIVRHKPAPKPAQPQE